MQVFKSKVDSWLLAVLVVSVLVPLFLLYTIGQQGETVAFTIILLIIIPTAALPLWLLLSTRYVVSGGTLKIYSGPFRWSVELAEISSVSDTRNPISSPALSLDRLEIKYGNGRCVLVSPADKRAFRAAIGQDE